MIWEVELDGCGFGGVGLGRHLSGKRVLVPGGFPGERLRVLKAVEKSSHWEVRDFELLKKASTAVPSLCAISHKCGGCPWLTQPLEQQRFWKEKIFREVFRRWDLPSLDWEEAVPSTSYREKILLRGRMGPSGGLGYLEPRSHNWVRIQGCPMAAPPLQKVLPFFQEFVRQAPQEGKFRLTLSTALDPHGDRQVLALWESVEGSLPPLKPHPGVLWQGEKKDISPNLAFPYENFSDVTHLTAPGLFLQVHREVNHAMRRWVQKWILSSEKILDLYCGTGNLSLGLAARGHSILGVESHAHALFLAQKASLEQGFKKTQWISSPVGSFLRQSSSSLSCDAVIVDPPRAGMEKESAGLLKNLAPRRILYVGCDPLTMSRDLEMFRGDYEMENATIFHLFPNTYHLESAVCLKSKSS